MGFDARATEMTGRLFAAFGDPASLTVPGGEPLSVTAELNEDANAETVPGLPRSAMRERLPMINLQKTEVEQAPPRGTRIDFTDLGRAFVVDSLQESTDDEWIVAAREVS
ncbi:head-tail joining protein [Abyssibacter profundi]|nr:hypothetical protein [Abyssibacter profundi]